MTGTVVLDAQSHLTHVYERHGFVADGDEFLDDGIPHTPMRRAPGLTRTAIGSRGGHGPARRRPAPPRSAGPHPLGADGRRGRWRARRCCVGVAGDRRRRSGRLAVVVVPAASSPGCSSAGRRGVGAPGRWRPRALELHARRGRAARHLDPLRAHPADRRRARADRADVRALAAGRAHRGRHHRRQPLRAGAGRRRPTSGSGCSTSPASMTSSELPPPPPPPPPDGPWVAGPPPTRRPVPIDTPLRTSPLTIALEAIGLAFFGAHARPEHAGRRRGRRRPGPRDRLRRHAAADGRAGGSAPTRSPTTSVTLDEGILQRRHRVVPFSRIQQVELRQQLTSRLFGIVARPRRDGRRRRHHRDQPALARRPHRRGAARPPPRRAAPRPGRPARRPSEARARSGATRTGRRRAPRCCALSHGELLAAGLTSSGAVLDGRAGRAARRASSPASTSTARPRCWRSSRIEVGITLSSSVFGADRLAAQRLGVRPHRLRRRPPRDPGPARPPAAHDAAPPPPARSGDRQPAPPRARAS